MQQSFSLYSRVFFAGVFIVLFLLVNCKKDEHIRQPKVETGEVTEIMATTAKVSGEIIDAGEGIDEYGHCWGLTANPAIEDSRTDLGSADETGTFASRLTELEAGLTYHVRAYALSNEVIYGKDKIFTTLSGIAALTTSEVTEITATTALSGGTITDNGGAAVTVSGICWSTSSNPTVADYTTSNGTGTGSYTSNLSGLQANTTYYVRAYATTEYGTGYGNEVFFLTKGLSEVTTAAVSSITDNTAVCGGTVTNDWGFTVTARGVCWSTTGEPTLESNDGYTIDGSGTGSFISNITGLSKGTTYYVRAYATNSIGTSYGAEMVFETTRPWECGTSTIADYDGNEYGTVQIGSQCWMQENLKVTHYADGEAIPLVEGTSEWDALIETDKAYCYYDNSTASRDVYGALYTWAAAMDGVASSDANPSGVQGVCPDGWHLPGDSEWKQLEMFLGMSQAEADGTGSRGTDEGGKLKENGTTHWVSPNTGATNSSGFTALPGGYRYRYGNFYLMGTTAAFWSSTEASSYHAWARLLYYDNSEVGRYSHSKDYGFSVRCLKDL